MVLQMDNMDFEELLEDYELRGYNLRNRTTPQPHEYDSFEARIATAIHHGHTTVPVPKNDFVYLAMLFIASCPSHEWEVGGFPLSACKYRSFPKAREIFGADIGAIFTALAMYYGSFEIFSRIRQHYTFDLETGILKVY